MAVADNFVLHFTIIRCPRVTPGTNNRSIGVPLTVSWRSAMSLCLQLYINLYSPTSGSKERNIQTYKYDEKATKEKKQRNNSEQV